MGFQTIPETDQQYALLSFDANGVERTDDPQARREPFSTRLIEQLRREQPTDIFFMSHGWKGDFPAAIRQYDNWFASLENNQADGQAMSAGVGTFRPYRIALHWPSLPWGDEEIPHEGESFDPTIARGVQQWVDTYAQRLGDSPQIRDLLTIIFDEARRNVAASTLSENVREAYRLLDRELNLGSEGAIAAPGDDREAFDPDRTIEDATNTSFGGFDLGGILAPLRQLSFWTMKKRARAVGEGGMHNLLGVLQNVLPTTRLHLMGHSFGCIVVSSMLNGPTGASQLSPVSSLVLVQGALSIWSYCSSIPYAHERPGYFHRLITKQRVSGPIVTTRSKFDTAVGKFYPIGASLVGDVAFGEFPKYGGLGTFGIQGLESDVFDLGMGEIDTMYGFDGRGVYNLDASLFICHGEGASGAHNDIAWPQVAHVIWQAALSGAVAARTGIGA